MSYTNININFCQPMDGAVNGLQSKKSTFFTPNIFFRLGKLNLILPRLFALIGDTFLGVTSGILAALTLGQFTAVYKFASNHLKSTNYAISNLFATVLDIINPISDFNSNVKTGFITDFFYRKIRNFAMEQSQPDKNFFSRHVVSRLAFALLGGACLVTRTLDGLISIPATVLSFLTLGLITPINTIAKRSLQWPGILNDELYTLKHVITPWAAI